MDESLTQAAPDIGAFLDPEAEIEHVKGAFLPHWRQPGVVYFTTFRLADSLPDELLAHWTFERTKWVEAHPLPWSEEVKRDYYQRFPRQLQTWLDAGHGSCILQQRECRELVENALLHFDEVRYRLGEHVVASNHVHALVTPLDDFDLGSILHSWKSFTSHELAEISEVQERLKGFWESRQGRRTIWQKESFDHIVRSSEALERIGAYNRRHNR